MNAHVTHYRGSKGAVEIGSMPLPYAANALAKLQRERVDTSRDAEIEAIAAHVAKLQEEHVEAGAGEPEAPPARVAAEDANPRVALGDNSPPEATAYEAVKAHIDDLLVEARNWADGAVVETQAQADEASRLIDDLRKAAKAAEDAQAAEQKVHDDAIAEIRGRYRPLIQDPKTKNPGAVWKAITALKACVQPFLKRLDDEREAAARKAREEAAAAAKAAQEAAAAAHAADLNAQEAAEELVQAAKEAEAGAKRIEGAKVQARGGDRAMGLRTAYRPVLLNPAEALRHYAKHRPDDLKAALQRWAEEDVRRGIRTIGGFEVIEERVL